MNNGGREMINNLQEYMNTIGKNAKDASRLLNKLDTVSKNNALLLMADKLVENTEKIVSANALDVSAAELKGTPEPMIDRLMLNEKRIQAMAKSIREIASLNDPINDVIEMKHMPNNLQIGKTRVPLGVIGIIYESRPNVTSDAATLCLKAGNAVILRGGSDAVNSNMEIAKTLSAALQESGLPKTAIQYVEVTDRAAVDIMMKLNKYIDVLIPRGGASLINNVVNNSSVPVIETGIGNCHVFVDETADLAMAEAIVINAKTQRPGVCNAMETLLVHKAVAECFLPKLSESLKALGVEIRGCTETQKLVSFAKAATEEDYATEFLDLILAVKVVDSLDEALDHIYKYSSGHSEAIITNSYKNSQRFLREVDSAAVYVNASTRFTDGGEFGFGGEIGISTQKLHARGPMGVNELTTTKYIIYGEGQIR